MWSLEIDYLNQNVIIEKTDKTFELTTSYTDFVHDYESGKFYFKDEASAKFWLETLCLKTLKHDNLDDYIIFKPGNFNVVTFDGDMLYMESWYTDDLLYQNDILHNQGHSQATVVGSLEEAKHHFDMYKATMEKYKPTLDIYTLDMNTLEVTNCRIVNTFRHNHLIQNDDGRVYIVDKYDFEFATSLEEIERRLKEVTDIRKKIERRVLSTVNPNAPLFYATKHDILEAKIVFSTHDFCVLEVKETDSFEEWITIERPNIFNEGICILTSSYDEAVEFFKKT